MALPANYNLTLSKPPTSTGSDKKSTWMDDENMREIERWSKGLPFPRIQRVRNEFTPTVLAPGDDINVILYPDDTDGFFAGEHGVYMADIQIRYRQATDASTNYFSILANFDIMESVGYVLTSYSAGSYVPRIAGYKDFPYAEEVFSPNITLTNGPPSGVGAPSDSDLSISNVTCVWTFWPQGITNTLTRRSLDQGYIPQ